MYLPVLPVLSCALFRLGQPSFSSSSRSSLPPSSRSLSPGRSPCGLEE